MQHKFPFTVLNIHIDGKNIDVNVHPKKMEVRFSSDEYIYYFISEAISKTLKNTNLIFEEKLDESDYKIKFYSDDIANEYEKQNDDDDRLNDDIKNQVSLKNDNVVEIKEPLKIDDLPSFSNILNKKVDEGLSIENLHTNLGKKYEEKPFIQKTLTEDHKYIGQIFNTYVLVEFEDKLYIIDQHAAHEKINFEKIMKLYNSNEKLSQKIFPSIVLKLTPIQYESIMKNIDEFTKIGYEIESFGDNDIKVDAVPYDIFNIGNEKLLMDMIDSFADGNNKEQYESIVEKIASISCKKSIKANHILSETEVKELLRELFKLDNPYNCPHGRPTIISLSKQEFEKKFGRIV